MPQLDKVTFFSQYFWLCLFFFGFYIFQLKFFLPEMSRILKFRKKKLSESSTVTLQGENDVVRNSTETALENLFKNLRNVFKNSSLTNDKWFSEHRAKFSQDFKKGNLKYLKSIAKKSMSNNLAIQSVRTNFSSKVSMILFTQLFLLQKTAAKRNFTTLSRTSSSSIEDRKALGKKKNSSKKQTILGGENNVALKEHSFSSGGSKKNKNLLSEEEQNQTAAKKTAGARKNSETKKKKKS